MDNLKPEELLQNKFKEKVIETINYIKKFSRYEVFAYFYFHYKESFVDTEENDTDIWSRNRKILFLQILYSCTNKIHITKKINTEELKNIDKLLHQLNVIVEQYYFSRILTNKNDEQFYKINSLYSSRCNGKRYDIFEIIHHKDLLNICEQDFKKTYKFKINELYNGIEKLKNNFYFEFEKNINNLQYFNNNPLSTLNKSISKQTIELANLRKVTKWTNKFIKLFIVEKTKYKSFINNITIENWSTLANKIKYKPIIKINNNYYLLLETQFYDNLDRTVIQGICKNLNKQSKEQLRYKYTSNIEKIVAGYFQQILHNSKININNFYDFNKKIIENDVLIEYDNHIFIIEVKAGNFTPELAVDDIESHKKSLHNLIEVANAQQNTLETCLLKNKKIDIYDDNNKKTRNKKAEIKINKETNIFKIIVTAESFNDIEVRTNYIKILSLTSDTILLCLDDLRIYSEYFNQHPCYFIQYLFERRKNHNPDFIDELCHLETWIENHNHLIQISKYNEDIKFHFGFKSEIKNLDKYYNNLYFNTSRIDKPKINLPIEIEKIITFCEKNNINNNYSYFSTFLINRSLESLKEFENNIIKVREQYKTTNKNLYISIYKNEKNDNNEYSINIYDYYMYNKLIKKHSASKNNKYLDIVISYNINNQIDNMSVKIF